MTSAVAAPAVVTTAGSIGAVPADDWDDLVGDGMFYASHAWLRAVEKDRGLEPCYLLARSGDGRLVGVLPTYLWDGRGGYGTTYYDPFHVFCNRFPAERRAAWLPLLLIGSRAGYENEIVVDRTLPPAERAETMRRLVDAALALAAERGAATSAMMFIRPRVLEEAGRAFAGRAKALLTSADASLRIRWSSFDEYVEALDSGRRQVRRDVRRFTSSGLTWKLEPFGDSLDEQAALLASLQRRYGIDSDVAAVRAHLAAQAEELADHSVVFVCRSGREVVGFALLYRWRGELYARACGFAYDRLGDERAYFNLVFYLPIRYAIEHGLRTLHLGVGSWEAKLRRGATLAPLWSLVRPPARIEPDLRAWLDEANADEYRWWIDTLGHLDLDLPHESWVAPAAAGA